MKDLCASMHLKLFFQQDDTKIVDFDESILILWPFFWGNVIFKICHSCLNSHNWRTENFHCLAPRGKLSALALKSEDSMNKEKHSLYNFAVLQSGGSYSSLPQWWLLIQKKQILKIHCLRKMALESKRLNHGHWSWCHFAGKWIFYALMHSIIWFSPWFLWNKWS